MAEVRPITDWEPLWFFPFVETRKVAAYLATDPRVMMDLLPPWTEYRLKRSPPFQRRER